MGEAQRGSEPIQGEMRQAHSASPLPLTTTQCHALTGTPYSGWRRVAVPYFALKNS